MVASYCHVTENSGTALKEYVSLLNFATCIFYSVHDKALFEILDQSGVHPYTSCQMYLSSRPMDLGLLP